MYTGCWIEEGYILGPRDSGRFWIQDGWICGPRNSGKYWIQDGCTFGPKDRGDFSIDDGPIYGPTPLSPGLIERAKLKQRIPNEFEKQQSCSVFGCSVCFTPATGGAILCP